jgi:transposase InsO family protein
LEAQQKEELLEMFDQAREVGMTQERLGALLGLERHRLSRWRVQKMRGSLEDGLPGPRQAPHRLLPEERDAFFALAAREDLADASVPVLCAYGSDTDVVHLSPSTGYRLLKEAHLSEPRGSARHRHPLPRINHDLAVSPNCLWCWDITPLATYTLGLFYYLYAILDEYSRYVVAWRLDWTVRAPSAKEMFKEAIDSQHILDLSEGQRPRIVSDRGSTMKSKLLGQTLEPIHMLRYFTRPSTPTDNPFIESFFSTLKGHPTYPGRFETFEAAQSYCLSFFPWYNHRHLHSAIGFVTPADKHFGKASTILELRMQKSRWARQRRLSTNRSEQFKLKLDT